MARAASGAITSEKYTNENGMIVGFSSRLVCIGSHLSGVLYTVCILNMYSTVQYDDSRMAGDDV